MNRDAASPRPSPPFGMEERVDAGRERRGSGGKAMMRAGVNPASHPAIITVIEI